MSDFKHIGQPHQFQKILVVDDEPLIRLLVIDTLEELGHLVVEAGSARQAIAALDADPAIGLLVTDVNLPGGIDGHQLVEIVRAKKRDLKVLFITGHAAGDDVADQATHVMTKPFLAETLATHVHELLSVPTT